MGHHRHAKFNGLLIEHYSAHFLNVAHMHFSVLTSLNLEDDVRGHFDYGKAFLRSHQAQVF